MIPSGSTPTASLPRGDAGCQRPQKTRGRERRPGLHLHADGAGQIISMLACARIGAVHSVVFGGFGAAALNSRITEAGAKVVITADVTFPGAASPSRSSTSSRGDHQRRDRRARRRSPARAAPPVEIHREMEVDFYDMIRGAGADCEPEVMDAEDPLFILYTSGSTGLRKGSSIRAGVMVGTYYTTKNVFDIKDTDVYWCTADPAGIPGIPTWSTARFPWVRPSS